MKKEWCKYRDILDLIDKYYPKECEFNSKQYSDSKEYRRYKKVVYDLDFFKKQEKEYYDLICSVFPGYYVKRWTNNTYSCFQFSVLLKENQDILDDDVALMKELDGKRYNLEIFISRISNYYYVYTSEEQYNVAENEEWTFHSYCATHVIGREYIKRLKKEMKKKKLTGLSKRMIHIEVPFIETELLPRENHNVEIFNCLFSDMIIDYY